MFQLRRHLRHALLLLVASCSFGCMHLPGGIAASSTPLDGKTYTVTAHATGTDSRILLLGFLPLSGPNTTREALASAVASKGGDGLINVTVEFARHYWVLWVSDVTLVEGDVIKFDSKPR